VSWTLARAHPAGTTGARMTAYYNESDPYCAQWLRNLVAAELICPGDVDGRDIRDVLPSDLDGYRQVHLFAGIGLWSCALRMAGWSDDRPVWTASCPCQPFSKAGDRAGFADDRHLWPAAHWLIAQHCPGEIVGEQVAGPDGFAWLDVVSSDLEALGYTVAALGFSSAGCGAPNLRERLWWAARRLANASEQRCGEARRDHAAAGRGLSGGSSSGSGMEHTSEPGLPDAESRELRGAGRRRERRATEQPGRPPNPWSELEWIRCADGYARPTKPGLFPLAPRHPGDVAKLRAYGNAINPVAAAEVVRAWMGAKP
jgi:DNA (cytosine-5)-methyltransferase 1